MILLGKQYPCAGEKQLNLLIRWCTIDLAVFLLAGAPAGHGMGPDKALGLCVAGDKRDVAEVLGWGSGAVGWWHGWVCCSLRGAAVFDKATNPTSMVNFGAGRLPAWTLSSVAFLEMYRRPW